MATTLDTLVVRTRRFLRDYPSVADTTSASLTSSTTTVPVSDGTLFAQGYVIEVDYETMLVASVAANNLTVRRGWVGSTAVSHSTSSTVLVKPRFYAVEIVDALNGAKDEMYPYVYRPVNDTSLTGNTTTYEFTVPNMPGTYGGDSVPMPFISKIEILITGDVAYRPLRDWTVRRASTPKIVFRRAPDGGTLRVHGFGPFPDLSASGDTVDPLFPKNAERVLPLGAAVALLGSGEAGRSRQDTGARDDRESANRPGNAISLANQLERRFEKDLSRVSMPPMPKNIVSTL